MKNPAFLLWLMPWILLAEDWPTWRADSERSGTTSEKLAEEVILLLLAEGGVLGTFWCGVGRGALSKAINEAHWVIVIYAHWLRCTCIFLFHCVQILNLTITAF